MNTSKLWPWRGTLPPDHGAVHRRTGTPVSRLACAAGLLVALATGNAHAAGLGTVELASGLNERLDARIPVRDLGEHVTDAVRAGLASPARFRAAGIERHPQLQRLRFVIERTPSGGHAVRVRSSRPIVEPFVRFLLELEWPTGRLIREYTLLLDPPGTGSGEQRMAASRDALPETGSRPARVTAASAAGDTAVTNESRYGPVRAGSSAWSIAADVRPPGANIFQTMIAIYRANPGAFRNNDLGRIRAGVRLDIPSAETVTAIPPARAAARYRQHIGSDAADGTPGTPGDIEVADADAAPAGAAHADTGGDDTADADDRDSEPGVQTAVTVATAAVDEEADTRGAGEPRERGDEFAQLRGDLTELKTMVAELGSRRDADPVPADGQLQESVAQLTSETGRLRGELATVREKLATARAQGQNGTWAPVGQASGIVGLMTLLSAGAGGLGGFVSARRFSGRRPSDPARAAGSPMRRAEPAAVPAVAGEPLCGQSTEAESDAAAPDSSAAPASQTGSRAVEAPGPGAGGATGELIPSTPNVDFALPLADVYMASGRWADAENILHDAIEQQGDGPVYRMRLLRVMYQLGRSERFLQEFGAYRGVADPADPGWEEVRRMGRTLCPGHPVFTTSGNDADAAIDEHELEFDIDFEMILDDLSPAPPPSRTGKAGSAGETGERSGEWNIPSKHDGEDDDLTRH